MNHLGLKARRRNTKLSSDRFDRCLISVCGNYPRSTVRFASQVMNSGFSVVLRDSTMSGSGRSIFPRSPSDDHIHKLRSGEVWIAASGAPVQFSKDACSEADNPYGIRTRDKCYERTPISSRTVLS
jgi:hypothetical protein